MRVREKTIATVRELAAKALADHHAVPMVDCLHRRQWRCKRPQTWQYYFDVTVWPGVLVVTGDIGAMVVQRETDMIAWAREAVKDLDYFAGKVTAGETKCWSSERAEEWVKEQQVEHGMRRELAMSLLRDAINSESMFSATLNESGFLDGCDWPDLRDWDGGFLWRVEALRWFLQRVQ